MKFSKRGVNNGILLVGLVTTQVLGDIWLSEAMKQFGAITSFAPQALLALLSYLFTNVWVWLGILTLSTSLIIHFIAITRLDFSYVLPIHSSSYVLNALLAWLILKEQVTAIRWFATILIAIGAFVVGLSGQTPGSQPPKRAEKLSLEPFRDNKRLLFLGGISLPLSKVLLGALIMAIADSSGDLLTAIGIKRVGEVPAFTPLRLFAWVGRVISHPFMIAGIAGYAASFAIFISLLSWADISLVRPATAIGYIISLLGARYILQEHLNKGRQVGIVIIGLGLGTLSFS